MSTSFETTTLFIPHPQESGVSIVGVLEQVQPGETIGRKIALILHGSLGHKDYLFQKRLAYRLPIDSFRFDFRGNHETAGEWRMGALANDVADIDAVVAYLMKEYGYVVDLIVGHSRGAISGIRWMCTSEESKTVRGFVNVSGRYRMEKILDNIPSRFKQLLESQGYYLMKGVVARKEFVGKVTVDDVQEFVTFDCSFVWDQFPPSTHVFSLHGLKDHIVPPYDAIIYARAFGARSPGTHNLCYSEDADHNFTGMSDFVVETVLEWWKALEHGQLKTGIWNTGVRSKL